MLPLNVFQIQWKQAIHFRWCESFVSCCAVIHYEISDVLHVTLYSILFNSILEIIADHLLSAWLNVHQ